MLQPKAPPPPKRPLLIALALCIALPAMFIAKGKLHGVSGFGVSNGPLGVLAGVALVAICMWALWYLKKP